MPDIKDYFNVQSPEGEPDELKKLRRENEAKRNIIERERTLQEQQRRDAVRTKITDLIDQANKVEQPDQHRAALQEALNLSENESTRIPLGDPYEQKINEVITWLQGQIFELEKQLIGQGLLGDGRMLLQEADQLSGVWMRKI